jgi:RNA recognition motif-containing protein
MSICVDNLSDEVTEARLNSLLAEYGSHKRIHLSPERQTGRECGLAVVEMGTAAQEEAAIENLDGTRWYGRSLTLNRIVPPLPIQAAFKSKHTCPCCSHSLLRHISSRRISLFYLCLLVDSPQYCSVSAENVTLRAK